MKEWMEQGLGIMIIGGIIGAGLLARLVLFGYYVKLGKACKQIGTTKNKSLRYIKEGLEKYPTAGKEIKNAMVYTECRLAECRVFGIHVGAWEGIMEQSLLLVLLSGGLCALAGVMYESTKEQILTCLFLGGIGGVAVVVLDMLSGMKARCRRIRLRIRDYIENCQWPENLEEAMPELKVIAEEQPNKKQKKKHKDATVKKRKPKKIKKRHGKAQDEKRRLTEELLRDRRCLEAQRIAERREKEKETEQMQVEAEAAATAVGETTTEELSYEVLLRNVLAEYLG